MEHKVDFKLVREQAPIADVAATLGLTLEPASYTDAAGVKREQLRGECPICHKARALTITPSAGLWRCWGSCKRSGDVIALVCHVSGLKSPVEGAKRIMEGLTGGNGSPAPQASPEPRKPQAFDPLEYQKQLKPDHPSLAALGIAPETIKAYGGGYCSKGYLIGRLALPLTDSSGAISHFVGAALDPEQKPDLKFPMKNDKPVIPDLFGAHMVQQGVLFIAFHPLDVLRGYEEGRNTVGGLKPLTWDVMTTLTELLKEKDCELELF